MAEIRYEIRAATRADHEELLSLARHLDSVNLPSDPAAVQQVAEQSEYAFSGNVGDPRRRQYVFVLADLHENRLVGTSMILGQLGRKDAPYIYLDVKTEEKYSPSLDRHFAHQVLSIGYSFNGPTELGGLVMHPEYRGAPEKLGMLVSYVRFLWIAMHRAEFQNFVLAELMPPLESDGTSHLWEAVGRHFTHMNYREADRLSHQNKEFIRNLFPDGDIYVSLLSPEAQTVVGKVGRETLGVQKMLKRIGFRYANRVDPFDGGPHYAAPTDDIELVARSKQATVVVAPVSSNRRALIGHEYDVAPWFRAVPSRFEEPSADKIRVPPSIADHLGLRDGDPVWVLPLH